MLDIRSFLKLSHTIDIRKMLQTTREVATVARCSALCIFVDMMWCGFRYMSGYNDYALFEIWNMNSTQRSTVLTRGKNNSYVKVLNNHRELWKYFEEKTLFLRTFADFIHRPWIDLRIADTTALEQFAVACGTFIAKPIDRSHGDGVEKISAKSIDDWSALHKHLCINGQELCEAVITQHPEMDRLWSGAVNTIRIVTILSGDIPHIVAANLRIGAGERPVDNFNAGGLVVPLDQQTGVVVCHAVDKTGNIFEAHPKSGVHFEGFHVPMWAETINFVCCAATIVPDVRYVAWDVAITPDGPVFVEGNQYPGHDIYGLPAQTFDKIGVLPDWEAVIPVKELKKYATSNYRHKGE